MENRISVHNLKKNLGKLEILKNISVKIGKGEAVCMIGPSGSGKSTFLRYLNRLEKIISGHVVVDGHPIFDPNTNANKMCEDIGMAFQHFNLFSHLTVGENITLAPTELKLMRKEEADREALELLVRVGSTDKAEVYPGQLFGGQKQRVVIARSLAINPDIMLSDEPTSALDPGMAGEVLEVVKQLTADGMTMMVVAHETGLVRGVADWVVFMGEGYTMEGGTPGEVFGNPGEERTRSFLDKALQIFKFPGG